MWTARPLWTVGQLLVGIALIGCLPVVDRLGWVLLVPAAVAALGAGARDLLLRPTLQADAAELTVVAGARRVHAPWPDVERLRVVRDRRTPLLEIDLGDHVVVLPERRLGAPVEEVLAALTQLRQVS